MRIEAWPPAAGLGQLVSIGGGYGTDGDGGDGAGWATKPRPILTTRLDGRRWWICLITWHCPNKTGRTPAECGVGIIDVNNFRSWYYMAIHRCDSACISMRQTTKSQPEGCLLYIAAHLTKELSLQVPFNFHSIEYVACLGHLLHHSGSHIYETFIHHKW